MQCKREGETKDHLWKLWGEVKKNVRSIITLNKARACEKGGALVGVIVTKYNRYDHMTMIMGDYVKSTK